MAINSNKMGDLKGGASQKMISFPEIKSPLTLELNIKTSKNLSKLEHLEKQYFNQYSRRKVYLKICSVSPTLT